MIERRRRPPVLFARSALLWVGVGQAQAQHQHAAPADTTTSRRPKPSSFGVLTVGAVMDRIKVEASAFRGREPDKERWNMESPKLDSHPLRLSVNPTDHWALQMSYGRIHSPEQLEPEIDQDRTTASAMYDGALRGAGRWQGTHTLLARAERVEKDELFVEPDSRAGEAFDVGELTAGYRAHFWHQANLTLGIGAAGTLSQVPRELRDSYGSTPASAVVFLRAALH